MDWHYQLRGEPFGPVDTEVVKQLIQEGKLGRDDLVQNEKTNGVWVPIYQMLLLSGALPPVKDAAKTDELRSRLELLDRQHKRQQRAGLLAIGLAVLAVALAIAAAVRHANRAPYRLRGISAANPVGTFERIDRYFTRDLQMDRCEVTNCPGLKRAAPKMYCYSNPKAPHGKQVTTGGSITLLIDGPRLTGICASFTSSGPRAGTIYNNSVCGLWAKDTWCLYEPVDPPQHRAVTSWPAGTWGQSGLGDNLPRNGLLAVHDGPLSRGCWYEYGKHGLSTVIYLEPK
jgi:hypothetical protein